MTATPSDRMTSETNKVLIIVGDASETVDTLYPYYRLQEDGFVPVVAAPESAATRWCCTR